MTLKDFAWKLRQRLGKPDWLVSIATIKEFDSVVLLTKSDWVPPAVRKLADEGYGDFVVVTRVIDGPVFSKDSQKP